MEFLKKGEEIYLLREEKETSKSSHSIVFLATFFLNILL